MLTFRKKIFIAYILVFFFFIVIIFPFATHTVQKITRKAMEDRADELILKIQSAPNNDALIRRLKDQKPTLFFRVSVIDNERQILYDSHTKRLLGPRFSHEYIVDHPEVLQAFEEEIGYHEDYSELLEQKFAYLAKSFNFHEKKYVIRMAFPHKYVEDLTYDYEMGFLGLAIAILLLFSLMTWFIIHYLTRPIQQIINAVTPYQQGKETSIPEIKLKGSRWDDDFGKLAMTLNSLSWRIQKHIDSLIAERNEKEAILESLVEGVIAVDKDMTVIYANGTALKLLKIPLEKLQGQNFETAQQPKGYALLASCLKETKILSDTMTISRGGTKIYVDIIAAPNGKKSGAILIMEDKSSHYKILEMRKDFIANASHELKTPITIIRGFAEALHDNPDLSKSVMIEVTGKIVNNCQRMTMLIKDLLTLSDIENIPAFRLVECNLTEIIDNCFKTLHDAFSEAKLSLIVEEEEPMILIADPSLMELAMMNLIENSIKYSPSPAEVTVHLGKTESHVKIVISDKGIGIPEEDLDHIFERFYTVDKAHSQKMGGSGLGLSIVQTIVHKHSGQITVNSEFGKGTSFTIWLPTKYETLMG